VTESSEMTVGNDKTIFPSSSASVSLKMCSHTAFISFRKYQTSCKFCSVLNLRTHTLLRMT